MLYQLLYECNNYICNVKNSKNLHHSLPYLSGRTHRLVRDAVSAGLKKCGVEMQPSDIPVIGIIAAGKGAPVMQREIAERLEMDRHRILRTVREMEEDGFIRLGANPKNKRENLLELTEKGQKLFGLIAKIASEVIERAFAGCTAEERRITEQTLLRITRNLSQNEH